MSFTANDVLSALQSGQAQVRSRWGTNKGELVTIHEDDFEWWEVEDSEGTLTIDGKTYDWKCVEAETGGEGHGEYVYIVIKVDGRLFRQEGYYASHYGTDWDGSFEEVEAYEKPVTFYRAV